MGEDELLAYAESYADAARVAEVNLLRVAYQWAIAHSPDRLVPTAGSPSSTTPAPAACPPELR